MIHETKFFELRDEGTFVPLVAIRVRAGGGRVGALARRAGYRDSVLVTSLNGGRKAHADPYAHGGRTLVAAHHYIKEQWDRLIDGALIDVRVILGEESEPCQSELGSSWHGFSERDLFIVWLGTPAEWDGEVFVDPVIHAQYEAWLAAREDKY